MRQVEENKGGSWVVASIEESSWERGVGKVEGKVELGRSGLALGLGAG